MLVDHERVLVRLRQELAGRQGIGIGALFALIGELEAECVVEEGLPERALRLYGVVLSDDLIKSGIQPAPLLAQAPVADGTGSAPSNGAERATKEDTPHGSKHRTHAAAPA